MISKEEKKAVDYMVGERLRLAREAAGLTQERLAELVDITPQHMSDIERGSAGTSISTLIRFCKVLHVPSDRLLFDRHEPSKEPLLIERIRTLDESELAMAERAVNLVLEALASGMTFHEEQK